MIVRQARLGDASEICAIVNAAIRDTVATFPTKERSETDVTADTSLRWSAFQVVEEAGQVVGFANFGPFRDGPGYVRTRELTIHLVPQVRGRGLGRALMQETETVAVRQGVHVLVAGISGANPQAIAFHTACGFAEVGRMAQVGFKAGQWLDLVLMQKTLPEADRGADSDASAG